MKKALFLGAALLALATTAPLSAWSQDAAPKTAVKGQAAPDIEVGDWINGDGRTSLADFRGEVVFLEFWATT